MTEVDTPPAITLADRWERFWFAPIEPHIYALLRITLGVVGLCTLLRLADMSLWDLDEGLISDVGLVSVKTALRGTALGAIVGELLYVVCIVAFVLMTVGYRCAFAVPFALLTQLFQLSWNSLPLSGAHPVMQGMLFCLMWADTGGVWSLDSWLERRRGGAASVQPAIVAPLRLLRYQIALIYLVTGLWKLFNPLWRDGNAVHYVLNSNVFHRFPGLLTPALEPLAVIGTYLTMFWELGFMLLLLWRPTRIFVLCLGIAMHLGILATLEVGPFHFVMLAGYPAFLEPKWVADMARRFTSRDRARATAAVTSAG